MPPSIWPSNRASLLFSFVTAAVVIWLMAAAGARADTFDDAQAALEQAVAQAGGAPSPAAPAPVKKAEDPKKSWGTGGVAAPSAAAPSAAPEAPSNVNISVRVQSPGNDGAVIQQDHVTSDADFDRLERHLDAKFKRLEKQLSKPAPKIVMPVIRHETAKPPPPKRVHKTHTAPKPPPPHPTLDTRQPTSHTAQAPPARHRAHKTAAKPRHDPFQLPQPLDNQAMSAGSSGGTSTPPPAPIAALLAAACLAASMLVTSLWDAHRRRRSRLFASRLERPG